jgi:D-galactarolactone cycloisomerase
MIEPRFDTAFSIESLRSVRVTAPGPDYWRGFASASKSSPRNRFIFYPPWKTVYAARVETAVVRVRLSDGHCGWGEATCPIAPEVVCTILNGFVADVVQGRQFESVEAIVDHLYDAQRCRGYVAGHYQDAVAALDIALHDALGRRAGCPVSRLFAAQARAQIPCYLSGARARDQDARIEVLRQWADGGSSAAKLFLRGHLEADLEEFASLCANVPDITWWAVDALWSYQREAEAALAKERFGQLGASWLECPMLPEDLLGHEWLCRQEGAAIALGEHFRTALQAEPWISSRAVDVLQPDIGRTGFVMACRMLAQARRCGVGVTPHMGGALDVMQAATLHYAAICDDTFPCEYQAELGDRLSSAIRSDWHHGPRGFEVPDVPGLGVDVDEDALQPFVLS